MAGGFEKLGLGGVLTFDSTQAIKGMNRARASFNSLRKSGKRLMGGLKTAAGGLTQLSLAGAGASLVLGSMVKSSMDFEQQMSAVQAVSRATAGEMAELTKQSKRLGATTAFTATESAQAQEQLARAGFKVNEILEATPAILSAAAADSMELADASRIVAGVLRGMRLEAKEANHVADVLALTSASSATNITQLGDAFRYAAPQAAALGFSLEETAAALGKAADSMLIGSIGGTSFTNMLAKLAAPSSKARKLMNKWGISLTDAEGKIRPLADLVGDFKTQIDGVSDAAQRAAVVNELFGRRGAKAFNALSAAGPEALRDLTMALEQSSEGIGAAEEMARTRLDNMAGAVTILKSAWEGLSIEIGDYLIKNTNLKEGIQGLTSFLSDMVLTLQGVTTRSKLINGETEKYNLLTTTAGRVALGLKAGIEAVSNAIKSAVKWVQDIGQKFGVAFGGDVIQQIVKFGTIITIVMAALAPIGGAAFVIGIALSGLSSIIGGLGTALSTLAGPIGIVVLAFTSGFMLIRKDGESVGETLFRIFNAIRAYAAMAYENLKRFSSGFKEGIGGALETVTGLFENMQKEANDVYTTFVDMIEQSGVFETDWEAIGKHVGDVATNIVDFIAPTLDSLVGSFSDAAQILTESIIPSLKGIWTVVKIVGAVLLFPMLPGIIIALKVIWPLIGLIFKGVAWVVGKVIELVGWVGEQLAPVWDTVAEKVGFVLGAMGRLWEFVKTVAVAYFDLITSVGRALGEKLQPHVEKVKDAIVGTWNTIAESARKAWNWITSKVIAPAWNWISGVAQDIKLTFVSAFKTIRNVAVSIFSKLAPILAAPFKMVVDFISDIVKQLAGTEFGKAALEVAGVSATEVAKFSKDIGKAGKKLAGVPITEDVLAESKVAQKALANQLSQMQAKSMADAMKGKALTAAMTQANLEAAKKTPAAKAMKAKAEQQGQVVGAQQPCVTVDNKNKIAIDSNLNVDGSEIAVASAQHQVEISERSGFSTTPFQKRKVLEQGAVPATGGVPT